MRYRSKKPWWDPLGYTTATDKRSWMKYRINIILAWIAHKLHKASVGIMPSGFSRGVTSVEFDEVRVSMGMTRKELDRLNVRVRKLEGNGDDRPTQAD